MILAAVAATIGAFQPAPCALQGVSEAFEQKHSVRCGWVTVPLRQGASDGRSIRLWTARVGAMGPASRDDPVLYINGGPGIATVDSILPHLDESKTMALLREGRDVILFDQRGSGRSEQSLCPNLAKSLNAIAAKGLDADEEDSRQRAEFANCRTEAAAAGLDLEAYTTAAIVADLDVIRTAFGAAQWNLAAISYGTLVALHAMRTSPQSIRSVILNSPFPPNSAAWAEQSSTAAAAFVAIDRECAAQPDCKKRFGSIVPKLEATLARLERTPLRDGERLINGRQFAQAIWPLAVRSSTVKFVPLAIDRAYSGDTTLIKNMVAMFAGGGSFGGFSPAQAYAIGCHESGNTTEWYRRARALYPAMVSAAPDDSMDRLCAEFRPGFADASFFAPVSSAIPTLVYTGSLDAATPTIDAYQTTRFLSNATLVEVRGASHGPMVEDACTTAIARAFLAEPSAEPDVGCMAKRTPVAFATDGLDQLVSPPPK
jgi:pimeloyl-ACP methyl ester carboxylesterase